MKYIIKAYLPGGMGQPAKEAEANAARIVSCVNACNGINPEAVSDVVKACKEWDQATGVLFRLLDKLLPGWRQAYGFTQIADDARAALAKLEGRE